MSLIQESERRVACARCIVYTCGATRVVNRIAKMCNSLEIATAPGTPMSVSQVTDMELNVRHLFVYC